MDGKKVYRLNDSDIEIIRTEEYLAARINGKVYVLFSK